MTDAESSREKELTPLNQLHQQMAEAFNLENLGSLCFGLKINFDELPHSGLTPKIRDLIQLMKQNGRIADLHTAVSQVRPHIVKQHGERTVLSITGKGKDAQLKLCSWPRLRQCLVKGRVNSGSGTKTGNECGYLARRKRPHSSTSPD